MTEQHIAALIQVFTQPTEFLMSILLIIFLTRKLTRDFVSNLNSLSAQILAFGVILMGWGMLVACKKYQIDTTIAGGVIGVGSNMLQNKRPDTEAPPGGSVQQTETTTVATSTGIPDSGK